MTNSPFGLGFDQDNLPAQAKTKSGVIIQPRTNMWSYRDTLRKISLNFEAMPASPELISSIKQVLLWYAENLSPSHAKNMFDYFLMFLRFVFKSTKIETSKVTVEYILNYKSSLSEDKILFFRQD